MNTKTLTILALIAVVCTVLAVLGQRLDGGMQAARGSVGTLLLPELESALADVERVRVVGAGNEPLVTLTNTDEGWVVAEQDGYPADVSGIRDALVALAEARIVEEKTGNADFYDRLGVEDVADESASGLELTISTRSGDLPAVILGGTVGASQRYARLAEEDVSVLIDRSPEWPRDAAQWVVPELIDLRSDRVQSVEISHADGERLVITKSARAQTSFTVEDVPEGRELQYPTVATVIGNALRELRLEQAARVGDAPPEPSVTSEFRTFDGLVVRVTGALYGDEPWVGFDARYDAEQALAFADEEVAGGVATEEENSDEADASAEAAEIDARLAGWRFRIPAHQYDQMTRRMSELLRAPEVEPDE